jgi:hypothetical protein
MAGQRRRQIITQAHPLFVIVLEREDARIGPVHIRQELAQGVGVFEGRRFQRLEAVSLIDPPNGFQHGTLRRQFGAAAVAEAARQARLGALRFVFAHRDSKKAGKRGGCTGGEPAPQESVPRALKYRRKTGD